MRQAPSPRRAVRSPFVGLFWALGLCQAIIPFSVSAEPGPEIIDLIPQAMQILSGREANEADRATRFLEAFVKANPQVYQRPQLWQLNQKTAQDYVKKVREYLTAIEVLHLRFQREEPLVLDKFCRAFPDFAPARTKIYLMLSLFRFDAKVPSDHPDSLLLGLDGLARFHGSNPPLAVMLSHEFFHLYHFQVNPLPRNPDVIPLYRLLWQEGLAVYASRQLNPGASLADALLDPQLAAERPGSITYEAKRLLLCLDSQDDDVVIHFLAKSEGGTGPGRIGYLIGYEIVAHLAAKEPLSGLARLRDPGLRFTFRRELNQLIRAGGTLENADNEREPTSTPGTGVNAVNGRE
jgi:Predicted Zn-dependent protease (DUF2268)